MKVAISCSQNSKTQKGDITCQHIGYGDVLLSNITFLSLLF